uniref:Uncharacterized protein n=1 Tax=Rhizophora mucronata TaxID=61149 RepID=A0A2P2PTS6_RHIMU
MQSYVAKFGATLLTTNT